MIRPLRKRLRLISVLLLLALPAGLAAALVPRIAVPLEIPESLPSDFWNRGDLELVECRQVATVSPLRLIVRAGRTAANERVVELAGWKEPTPADVLLYWSPSQPEDRTLPPQATFLGPLERTNYPLPSGARGCLVLYGLADSEVLGSLALED